MNTKPKFMVIVEDCADYFEKFDTEREAIQRARDIVDDFNYGDKIHVVKLIKSLSIAPVEEDY